MNKLKQMYKDFMFPRKRNKKFYASKMKEAQIDADCLLSIKFMGDKLLANRKRYEEVAEILSVPWELVAALHGSANQADFRRCLKSNWSYQQDGYGSWEEMAVAELDKELNEREVHLPTKAWTLSDCLLFAEGFLGDTFFKDKKLHPKIWSFTNLEHQYYPYPGVYCLMYFLLDYQHKSME